MTLEFKVNNEDYVVTRYKEPKPDLKFSINGVDKSGKGIRESEAILAEYIPDLTSNLIASIIILGQGLPGKFSNNTPSGRKEVLEKLSKSDFMIQDLKNRLTTRTNVLNDSKRKLEDSILSDSSKRSVFISQLATTEDKLKALLNPHDFETELVKINKNISESEHSLNERKNLLKSNTEVVNQLNESLRNILNEKTLKIEEENTDFNEFKTSYLNKKYSLSADIKTLEQEITRLKSITDICPTCGQKIPGAKKPDTSEKEKTLTQLRETLNTTETIYKKNLNEYEQAIAGISATYQNSITSLNNDIKDQTTKNSLEDSQIKLLENTLFELKRNRDRIELEKHTYLTELENTKTAIVNLKNTINELDKTIEANNHEKQTVESHLNILNQMFTLIKRDFRGFLLSHVISFIDSKSKEYAKDIFGSDELEFKLDGNDIDIIWCNKMFESLSGGEKQKVDLIIQFAIRDMMSKYLNFSSNILILDEITDNLDSIGCNNVLNLISNKLNDVESIFIISHHTSELQIPCDCQMIVVKDRNGISSIR